MATRKPTEVLATVLDAGRAINVAELAEELMSAFGGARKFAEKYHTEFEGCKVGGIARMKMLDGVLRIITAAGAQNKSRGGADPPNMTDDELLTELGRIIQARGLTLGADDAKAEEAGRAAS